MKTSRTAFLSAFALVATLVSVQAQETTTTDTTEDPAQEQQQAPADDTLSLGEEIDESGPKIGEPYAKERNGAWELRCIRVEEGEEPCQAYQLISDTEGVPVAEFSMFKLKDGGRAEAGATVVVPLETALQQQLTITVDGGAARRYPFAFCNQIGCYSRIGLTAEDIAGFKRGATARISIVPALAPDQKVELDMSLSGFTKTYDQVSVVEQ